MTLAYKIFKRIFDILLSIILLVVFLVPLIVIGLFIYLSSGMPIIYSSKRVGIDNTFFYMPKFRTMKTNAPNVATHLLADSQIYITPIGRLLRKTSLDELPQLFSVLFGKMSFVGPRPALFNQYDLIEGRTEHEIHSLIPGITGWAQVNGRDELDVESKIRFDREYMKRRSFLFDLYIIILTVRKVLSKEDVKH